jgi:methionyl-tRNA formyltransferase
MLPEKKTINDFSIDDLKLILEQLRKEEDIILYFNNIEIIRKYISLKSRYLIKDLREKFGKLYIDYLNLFNLIFFEVIKKKNFRKQGLIDICILNSILSLKKYKKISSLLENEIDKEINKLKSYLLTLKEIKLIDDNVKQEFYFNYINLKKESKYSESIVILSPNRFSLYTGSVIEICKNFSIPIEAVIIRKFSYKRFFEESKRDGYFQLIKKIFHKLIIKGDDNFSYSEVSLNYAFKKLGLKNKNLSTNKNIKLLYVDNFRELENKVISLKSKIALFTGGGIVSENFINKFNEGIINLHVGNLPKFKGMDATEAEILSGYFNSIALTTNLMSKNVDSGPVLAKYVFSSEGYSKIGELFNEATALFPFMLVDSYLGFRSGRYKKINQKNEGRLYFTLNNDLKSLVNKILFERSKNHKKPELIKNTVNNILKDFT